MRKKSDGHGKQGGAVGTRSPHGDPTVRALEALEAVVTLADYHAVLDLIERLIPDPKEQLALVDAILAARRRVS